MYSPYSQKILPKCVSWRKRHHWLPMCEPWGIGGAAVVETSYCPHCGSVREVVSCDLNKPTRNGKFYTPNSLDDEQIEHLKRK